MDRQYCKSIFEYLQSKKQESEYTFNVLLNEENLTKKLVKDCSLFPCVIINGGYEYSTNNIQNNCLNFAKKIPASFRPNITILTDNISDMVEIEKSVTQWFENSIRLKIEQTNKTVEEIPYDISIDKSVKVDRSNKDFTYPDGTHTIYQSIIQLKSLNDVVIFMYDYHPAEIEFDKNVQFELVKRGKALEELKRQADTFTAEQKQQICSGYNEIISLLGITSFDGFGFTELYQVMSDNNCDINAALADCSNAVTEQAHKAEEEARKAAEEQRKEAERQQAEANRVEHINEIFGKQGDSVINRYTDGIIADINSRLDLPYSVSVYGGSTFSEWHRRNELNELDYPNILIKDIVKFSFEHKTYRTVDSNGNFIDRPFSTEILPINYGIQIEIHTKNKTQLAEIKQRIKEWYTEPQVALATLPLHDGEEFHVGIYFEDEINKPSGLDLKVGVSTEGVYFKSDYEPNKKTGVFCEKLTFHAYQSVYFVQPYSKTDLENNRRLQINLLKLAIFYGECSNKLSEAAKSLNGNYKELVSGKSSFLNFLNSQEFKTLKNCYDNGMPLDRNLFDSVFSRIVCVYPNLYDKTVQRLPYEQVQADIQKYANMFNDKFVELFTVLGVPTQFKRFSGEVPYLFTNLSAYAGRMEENAELSLDEALDLQESERIESDRLKREERAEREYQQSNSSGGHGFLSSLAHRGIENANIRRNAGKVGKRDLIGQAGCAKTYGGNCSTCNIRHGCSRYLY